MDNTNQAPAVNVGVRREPSIDPAKAQGILTSITKKERTAARQWQHRWGFLCHKKEVEEEEAQRIGLSVVEYRAAKESFNRKPEQKSYHVPVKPCAISLPPTSSGIVGRRALYPLETYGPLVQTPRDFPLTPPLPPNQVYDPYKQTMIFLGSVDGDPISHKQSPARCDITDEMWARPRQLAVAALDLNKIVCQNNFDKLN